MTYIPTQVAQQQGNEEREKQTLLLQKIEGHLSIVTEEELKEEDLNDSD